jgi:hypothetical protein
MERALRDAASAFKRELFEKGEELASLLVRPEASGYFSNRYLSCLPQVIC